MSYAHQWSQRADGLIITFYVGMLKSSGPPVAVGPPTQVRYDLFIDIVSVCFTGTLSGQLTLHTLQAGRPVHPPFVSIPFGSTICPQHSK